MSEPKPSAWLYERREDAWPSALSFVRLPEKRWTEDQALVFWTETPLYTREAIEAEIVAWLRFDADQTEIEARAIVRNTTGNARQNAAEWAELVEIKRGLANAIEQGQWRSKSDG